MKRRTLLHGAVASVLWAVRPGARAEPPAKIWRIGMLESVPAAENAPNLEALSRGLRELGYVEGRNLVIEYRSTDGHADRFAGLAAELVRLNVDLIVARGTPAALEAKSATASAAIPVVMATMGDPNAIVASYARPGGNITGVTTFSTELTAKRIELLKEVVPHLSRIGLLHNMGNPAAPAEWERTSSAARTLLIKAELLDVRAAADLDRAFERASGERLDALVVGIDGVTQANRQTIVDAAARLRLPAVYAAREFVVAGGLFSYSINYPDLYYRFAATIDRIFKGTKPADLPIEQPTKFELVLNLKAAKALGLTIAPSLLVRADEVIQ